MDNRNNHLGINKLGKNIRKSPLHQPNNNFANANRQQPQPQVYNINKNDFRNVVQQLTGSPAREPMPRPVISSPKPQNQRLQKIRPPPLTPFTRPPIHHPSPMGQVPIGQGLMGRGTGLMGPPMGPPAHYSNNNAFARPPPQFNQPPQYPPPGPNVAESPVSMYMRYLQNSIIDTGPGSGQPHQQPQFGSGAPGLLPTPPAQRMWGTLPLLPSPSSQFLLPSPGGFLNSPFPLLSPGYQFLPPLSPSFGFPPMGQTGILGAAPPSPGISFPLSPAGFFPVSSPRWRDQKS